MNEWINQISEQSRDIRTQLVQHPTIGQYVDLSLPIPRPFIGTAEIKLIVIGQDPTVQREASRQRITTVLNLNTKGNLTRYLDSICEMLKLDLSENVYATNACKCFFTEPPTAIYKNNGVDVIRESADLWLPLLHDELAHFPQATILSLGEPVLNLLVRDGGSRLMKSYWGYTRDWQQGTTGSLASIAPEFSTVGRRIFPFPHQPSLRKKFYSERLPRYVDYVLASN